MADNLMVDRLYLRDWSPENKTVVDVLKELGEFLAQVPEQYRAEAQLEVDTEDYRLQFTIWWWRPKTPEEIQAEENMHRQSRLNEVARLERSLLEARRKAGLE